MPSLNALSEFKSSFFDIANERDDVISRSLPIDSLPLPDTEAPPFEPSRLAAPAPTDDGDSFEPDSGAGGFDFSAFLNTLPVDVNPSPIDDILNDISPPSNEPPGIDHLFDENPTDDSLPDDSLPDDSLSDDSLPDDSLSDDSLPDDSLPDDSLSDDSLPDDELLSEDDFSIPQDLLSGLPEEESAPEDFVPEDFSTEEFPSDDFPTEGPPSEDLETNEESNDTELGELPDFDFPSAEPETESSDDDRPEVFDLGGEKQDGTLTTESVAEDGASDDELFSEEMPNFDDTPFSEGIDLGGETLDTPGGDNDLDLDSLLSDDSFSGFEGADTSTQDDSGFDGSLPDIDFPEDDISSTPGFGDEFESSSIELETEPEVAKFDASDDFVLPVLDEIFDNSKKAPTAPEPKRGLFGRRKEEAREEPESENIDEIQLEQDDLDRILETLHSYPLNLRVACEELIAERVLEPQQLSKLIRLLVNGANVKEMAAYAGELLGKAIVIPKSFQKGTGAEWEAEKASFAYVFVHNFLPVLRLFAFIAAMAASIVYLGYRFIYIPYKAETIYKRGYERIFAGEYQRANELFHQAFVTHRKKNWFYEYAKGFRDQRRYMLAEAKYDELLRYYPRDKQGVLEYADLETNYIMNYDKANRILQEQLLDYAPNDYEGLLAAGDNFFAWADSNPSRFSDRYEDARFSYARLLENYGWTPPVVERMMKYFIRTDNLKEVLNIRSWFDERQERKLSPASTAELGGYLLDKQLEEVKGVPDPYVESIESVRAMLLQAVREDPLLPEGHYHLARYYNNLGNVYEERLTLENAIRAFDLANNESVRRRQYNVDTRYRYANLLINNREFFAAEEQLVEGINLYEDYVSRNLITPSPQLGQLYALKGDLEYFVKTGDMRAALNNYRTSERYGWLPPEIQYRMGAAYYQLEDWGNALDYLFKASAELPLNRRLLYALGNTTYKRGDYFAAQGYYNRLLDTLENQRIRLPSLLPNDRPEFLELGERLMMARNNAGVVYEALADQTGNREYRSRALYLYSESARAWDSITRNPTTMARMSLTDMPGAPGVNLGFLNASNAMRPASNNTPEIFVRIDKDALEPSRWEELAPFGGLIN